MDLISRSCLLIEVKQTFVNWLRATPQLELPNATLAFVNDDATVLLVPEGYSRQHTLAYVECLKSALAITLFHEWITNEALWPNFVQQPFDYWFTLTYHSIVYDLNSSNALDAVRIPMLDHWPLVWVASRGAVNLPLH